MPCRWLYKSAAEALCFLSLRPVVRLDVCPVQHRLVRKASQPQAMAIRADEVHSVPTWTRPQSGEKINSHVNME